MAMSANDVMKMIKEKEVKFVDLRFTDTRGKEQHVSVPVKAFTMDKFESGHFFDGSSIAGWKSIEASDMLLMPDPDSANGSLYRRAGAERHLRLRRALRRQGLRPRPAHHRQARRGPPEVKRRGRYRLFRARARVLRLRLGDMEGGHVGLLLQDQIRGSALVLRGRVRGRQHGPPRPDQGRLLPGAAYRYAAGYPQRHGAGTGAAGRRVRSASP